MKNEVYTLFLQYSVFMLALTAVILIVNKPIVGIVHIVLTIIKWDYLLVSLGCIRTTYYGFDNFNDMIKKGGE